MTFKKTVKIFSILLLIFIPLTTSSVSARSQVSPFAVESGTAGIAKLFIHDDRSTIWWSYSPNVSEGYYFTGLVTVTFSKGRNRVYAVSGENAIGNSVSGTVETSRIKSVTFSGTAFFDSGAISTFNIIEQKSYYGGGSGMRTPTPETNAYIK